ncbi:response regulator transcription factor [Paenibacillus sp. GP183]|jgi:two-component system, NarL family, competent response regulator ComA|uniref:response regulator transcription factor n=1 Tax=Paenibacillus sp. GP183 TaxID=1882751 RepID=UPI00089C52A2|nr:response regulator transcription factor [Paenibacillus sp. GP183]SEC48086.1 two component transcriptional regulator, LuxR family [Paenibacillus sp. GP183]
MSETMKALVVEDHPLIALATKELLDKIDGINVIGIASTGKQCMELMSNHQPQLVFLDYTLPDQLGTQIAKEIKDAYPDVHIVIFTGVDTTELYNKFIDLKVSGILSKEASVRTIHNMVNCILDNHTMLPIGFFHQTHINEPVKGKEIPLQQEEILIMSLMVKGSTIEQIADQIHMSRRTVDNYLKKIYEKLGVPSRISAVEKFIQSKYYLS